jgi:hypothetical protein
MVYMAHDYHDWLALFKVFIVMWHNEWDPSLRRYYNAFYGPRLQHIDKTEKI